MNIGLVLEVRGGASPKLFEGTMVLRVPIDRKDLYRFVFRAKTDEAPALLEITDAFDGRWVFEDVGNEHMHRRYPTAHQVLLGLFVLYGLWGVREIRNGRTVEEEKGLTCLMLDPPAPPPGKLEQTETGVKITRTFDDPAWMGFAQLRFRSS